MTFAAQQPSIKPMLAALAIGLIGYAGVKLCDGKGQSRAFLTDDIDKVKLFEIKILDKQKFALLDKDASAENLPDKYSLRKIDDAARIRRANEVQSAAFAKAGDWLKQRKIKQKDVSLFSVEFDGARNEPSAALMKAVEGFCKQKVDDEDWLDPERIKSGQFREKKKFMEYSGLDKPIAQITVTLDDQSRASLIIGGQNPINKKWFLLATEMPGKKRGLVRDVPAYLLRKLALSSNGLVSGNFHSLASDFVAGVDIRLEKTRLNQKTWPAQKGSDQLVHIQLERKPVLSGKTKKAWKLVWEAKGSSISSVNLQGNANKLVGLSGKTFWRDQAVEDCKNSLAYLDFNGKPLETWCLAGQSVENQKKKVIQYFHFAQPGSKLEIRLDAKRLGNLILSD